MASGSISYRLADMEDMEEIMEVMRDTIVVDEPLYEAAGLPKRDEENANIYKIGTVVPCLKSNVSFVAIDKNTDKMIGFCLNQIKQANDNVEIVGACPEPIRSMLISTDNGLNVFQHYLIERVLKLDLLAIRNDYRRRGVATVLWKMSLEQAAKEGCQGACSHISHAASHRICEKNGFEVLHEVVYSGYKVDGKVLFEDTGVPKSYILMGKKF